MLDLEVEIRPCPQGASATRAALLKEGSKVQVPYLKDPNNSPVVGMYESSDIIEYLFENYGPGKEAIPWTLAMRGLAVQTSAAATVARKLGGCKRDIRANPNNHKMKPLELWCYQGSPFVAAVREKLTELELPHKIVFCARGSSNRKKLVALTGSQFQIPWIKDPNTGVEMFESFEIAEYLDAVYRIDA
jgi:glutathione S-transferase